MSSEFFYDKHLFVAPKIGASFYGGVEMGASFICYTDFRQSSLQFRPEIGTGMDGFRFYYGRNMRIANTNFNLVSKNLFGINVLFNATKPKTVLQKRKKTTHP